MKEGDPHLTHLLSLTSLSLARMKQIRNPQVSLDFAFYQSGWSKKKKKKKPKKQWVVYELAFRCQCDILAKGVAFANSFSVSSAQEACALNPWLSLRKNFIQLIPLMERPGIITLYYHQRKGHPTQHLQRPATEASVYSQQGKLTLSYFGVCSLLK